MIQKQTNDQETAAYTLAIVKGCTTQGKGPLISPCLCLAKMSFSCICVSSTLFVDQFLIAATSQKSPAAIRVALRPPPDSSA